MLQPHPEALTRDVVCITLPRELTFNVYLSITVDESVERLNTHVRTQTHFELQRAHVSVLAHPSFIYSAVLISMCTCAKAALPTQSFKFANQQNKSHASFAPLSSNESR